MNGNQEYLGDSVYVECNNGVLRLTTQNGFGPTNEIFIEPEVLQALRDYISRCEKEDK